MRAQPERILDLNAVGLRLGRLGSQPWPEPAALLRSAFFLVAGNEEVGKESGPGGVNPLAWQPPGPCFRDEARRLSS